MRFLFDLPHSERKQWFMDHHQPAFRLRQLEKWLFQPGIQTFDAMSDLSKELRQMLSEDFCLRTAKILRQVCAEDASAEKFLLEWQDGNTVECVLLHNEHDEDTLCVSTQVGCAMGCVFCASGLGGFVRNLTAGEILEQFLLAADQLQKREKNSQKPKRLAHAVIMGMGEPTRNLEALLEALETVTSPQGMNLGARKITISTVGIPQGIERLAEWGKPYHLAVSLHAPNDALRSELIPANRNVGIEKILRATDFFFQKTGRRVTFEYILIEGKNDSLLLAEELAKHLKNRNAVVNLIPFNPVPHLAFHTPSPRRVEAFAQILTQNHIPYTIRHRKGNDIHAACGQLRAANR